MVYRLGATSRLLKTRILDRRSAWTAGVIVTGFGWAGVLECDKEEQDLNFDLEIICAAGEKNQGFNVRRMRHQH